MKLYARIENENGKEVDISGNEKLALIMTHKNKPVISIWLSLHKNKDGTTMPIVTSRNWNE